MLSSPAAIDPIPVSPTVTTPSKLNIIDSVTSTSGSSYPNVEIVILPESALGNITIVCVVKRTPLASFNPYSDNETSSEL